MINIYAPNIRAPIIYRAYSDRRNSNRMIVDLNTLFSKMDREFRQEIKKETADLNNTIDQMDLTNIHCMYVCMYVFCMKVAQLHLMLCDPIDYIFHGIFRAEFWSG